MPFFNAPALYRLFIVPTSTHTLYNPPAGPSLLNKDQMDFAQAKPFAHIATHSTQSAQSIEAAHVRVVNAGILMISDLKGCNPSIALRNLRDNPKVMLTLSDEGYQQRLNIWGEAFVSFDVNLNTIMLGYDEARRNVEPRPIIVLKVTACAEYFAQAVGTQTEAAR